MVVCLIVCLLACWFVCLLAWLVVCLFVCLSVCLLVCLFVLRILSSNHVSRSDLMFVYSETTVQIQPGAISGEQQDVYPVQGFGTPMDL